MGLQYFGSVPSAMRREFTLRQENGACLDQDVLIRRNSARLWHQVICVYNWLENNAMYWFFIQGYKFWNLHHSVWTELNETCCDRNIDCDKKILTSLRSKFLFYVNTICNLNKILWMIVNDRSIYCYINS